MRMRIYWRCETAKKRYCECFEWAQVQIMKLRVWEKHFEAFWERDVDSSLM